MNRYTHHKAALLITDSQKAKLEDAAWLTCNARAWALVKLRDGTEAKDGTLKALWLSEKPVTDTFGVPEFIALQALRVAADDWRKWEKSNKTIGKPGIYGQKGSYKIRIWNADSGKANYTDAAFHNDWLGWCSIGATLLADGVHCVNAVRTRTGWVAAYSLLVSTSAGLNEPIPETFVLTPREV